MVFSRPTFRQACFMTIGIVGLFAFMAFSVFVRNTPNRPVRFGITYSTTYATFLGLDPLPTYKALIDELGVRAIRFPVYWSELEPERGVFRFETLDPFVAYAEEKDVKLTLAVGQKVPRWPECFVPDWAKALPAPEQHAATKDMLQAVLNRYKDSPAIERWQVENEPFLPFGECTQITNEELSDRIRFVRVQDTRPVQLTASGEMGPWKSLAKRADVFGISVYRKTWNRTFGYFTYPLSPLFYRARFALIAGTDARHIISELQAEPWFSEDIRARSTSYWYEQFRAEDFVEHVQFAKDIGASEAYLWGAEWWVYLKQQGEPRLWHAAQDLFLP